MSRVILIGAGGHARSVMDIVLENGEFAFFGCLSDFGEKDVLGVPVIGGDAMIPELAREGVRRFFVGVGDNRVRNKFFDLCTSLGMTPINIISKHATVSKLAKIGAGVCILHNAVVHVNSILEDNCIINTGATVDHDCVIGKSAHISVGSHVCGYTKIGEETLIGPGAVVRDKIAVGSRCVVGMGAAVVKSIEDNTVSYGVPARTIKRIEE